MVSYEQTTLVILIMSVVTLLIYTAIVNYLAIAVDSESKGRAYRAPSITIVQGLGVTYLFAIPYYAWDSAYADIFGFLVHSMLFWLAIQFTKLNSLTRSLIARTKPEEMMLTLIALIFAMFSLGMGIENSTTNAIFLSFFVGAVAIAGLHRIKGFKKQKLGERVITISVVTLFFASFSMPIVSQIAGQGSFEFLVAFYMVLFPIMLSMSLGVVFSEGRGMLQTIDTVSKFDKQTGMYNRRYLDEEGYKLVELSHRNGAAVAVMLITIDLYRSIKAKHGYQIAGQVEKRIGQKIKEFCRETDIAIRYGNEEFLVLLPFQKQNDALLVATRLKAAIYAMPMDDLGLPSVSVSIALESINQFAELDDSIAAATEALYDVSRYGFNQVLYDGGYKSNVRSIDSVVSRMG